MEISNQWVKAYIKCTQTKSLVRKIEINNLQGKSIHQMHIHQMHIHKSIVKKISNTHTQAK